MANRTPPSAWPALFNPFGGGLVHVNLFTMTTLDPFLTNAKMVNGFALVTSTGNTALYTVPANRKAIIRRTRLLNESGVTITYILSFSANGNETRLTANNTLANNSAVNIVQPAFLNAGETLTINVNAQPLRVFPSIIEFDASSPLLRAEITAPIVGDNLLYSVPTGYTAALTGNSMFPYPESIGTGEIYASCVAVGPLTSYTVYLVPSGQTVGPNYRTTSLSCLDNNRGQTADSPSSLSEGDALWINTPTAAGTQTLWCVLAQIPLP